MNRSLHTKRSLKVQKEEQKLLKDEIGWQPLKESTKLPKVLKDEIGDMSCHSRSTWGLATSPLSKLRDACTKKL